MYQESLGFTEGRVELTDWVKGPVRLSARNVSTFVAAKIKVSKVSNKNCDSPCSRHIIFLRGFLSLCSYSIIKTR